MGKSEFSWVSIDLGHELQGEHDEAFDEAVAAAIPALTKSITEAGMDGDVDTLETLAEDFAHRVSQSGITEQLIRATLVGGAHAGGQMLLDLIQKGIDDAAELAALKQVEQRVPA